MNQNGEDRVPRHGTEREGRVRLILPTRFCPVGPANRHTRGRSEA